MPNDIEIAPKFHWNDPKTAPDFQRMAFKSLRKGAEMVPKLHYVGIDIALKPHQICTK